jgi:excisionase family DNA binding protein
MPSFTRVLTLPPASDPDWLSLAPAARLLGVDPDTLRRWADDGRIEAFTTPGGHRRFARQSLDRLIAARRPDPASLATMGATPERMSRAYARSYAADRGTAADPGATAHADREAFRRDGRRLVAALLAHVDAPDAAARDAAEVEAVGLTDDIARRLAEGGTSLTEAVALFVTARRPFLTELGSVARRRSLDAQRVTAAYEDASGLLDRLLLRLVATFERATEPVPEQEHAT